MMPSGSETSLHEANQPDESPRSVVSVEAVLAAAALLHVALITLTHLPPGVCFEDPGELQVCAAVLGIAHPPGYAGYITFAHFLTRLPFVSPAHAVTLGCWLAGLLALALLVALQIRLGVNPALAAGVMVLVACHPDVWVNLTVPEVYAPTLALLVGGIAAFLVYARNERRHYLALAALLIGCAVANRPPTALLLPVFAVGLLLTTRGLTHRRRRFAADAGLAVALVLLPCVYSVAYVVARDTPDNLYNYVDHYALEHGTLPPAEAGPEAKTERATWLLTGGQFRQQIAGAGVRPVGRLRWAFERLSVGRDWLFLLAAPLVVLGALRLFRRDALAGLLITGLLITNLVFVSLYQVWDSAADLMPAVFAVGLLAGGATVGWFGPHESSVRRALPVLLCAGVIAWSVLQLGQQPRAADEVDATAWLDEAQIATLPTGATILSTWPPSLPLRYAQTVEPGRTDLRIVTAHSANWDGLIARLRAADGPHRALYLTQPHRLPRGLDLVQRGVLWEVVNKAVDGSARRPVRLLQAAGDGVRRPYNRPVSP